MGSNTGLTPLYAAIEFDDCSHMTYDYTPGGPLKLPPGLFFDDSNIEPKKRYSRGQSVIVMGEYQDNKVKCLIVRFNFNNKQYSHQPNGILLHITTWTDTDTPPVQSGIRATNNSDKIIYYDAPYIQFGTWYIQYK